MGRWMHIKIIALLMSVGVINPAFANDMAVYQSIRMQEAEPIVQSNASDIRLTKTVIAALSGYAGEVTISVQSGIVYLSGQLPSDDDYSKVVMLSESVKGVLDVNADNLTVTHNQHPLYDIYLTAKVKGALIQNDVLGQDVSSWTVQVETTNNTVYLSGTVRSEQKKEALVKTARSVKGVNEIQDTLKISHAPVYKSKGSDTNDQSQERGNKIQPPGLQ